MFGDITETTTKNGVIIRKSQKRKTHCQMPKSVEAFSRCLQQMYKMPFDEYECKRSEL